MRARRSQYLDGTDWAGLDRVNCKHGIDIYGCSFSGQDNVVAAGLSRIKRFVFIGAVTSMLLKTTQMT